MPYLEMYETMAWTILAVGHASHALPLLDDIADLHRRRRQIAVDCIIIATLPTPCPSFKLVTSKAALGSYLGA